MPVIAIANQKGGVGKTTTAVNLGASLAAAEKRTLVVDLDPQGNASSGLLPAELRGSARSSLYGVLFDGAPLASAVVRSPDIAFLDVVPTSEHLLGGEVEMANLPGREQRLREALLPVRDLYDFVLLDCPPALGLYTLGALVAADSVLVPVQAEFFALEGLSQLLENLELVKALNPSLRIEGALITMFDGRLSLAQSVAAEVRGYLGERTFATVIPRNVRLAEAPSFERPVLAYDARSAGARSYLSLAVELMQRYGMPVPVSGDRKGRAAG
jgi:chromosome partitioning protein